MKPYPYAQRKVTGVVYDVTGDRVVVRLMSIGERPIDLWCSIGRHRIACDDTDLRSGLVLTLPNRRDRSCWLPIPARVPSRARQRQARVWARRILRQLSQNVAG